MEKRDKRMVGVDNMMDPWNGVNNLTVVDNRDIGTKQKCDCSIDKGIYTGDIVL